MTKKGLITFLLTLFACMPSMAATSLDDAKELVEKYLADSLKNPSISVVYSIPDDLEKIEIFYRESIDVPASVWKFYVDPDPNLGIAHEANIVFISKNTGNITIKKIDMQPKMDKNWSVIYDPSSFFDFGGDESGNDVNDQFEYNGILYNHNYQNVGGIFETKKKDSPDSYAVIVSGGVNYYNNWIRYWNDCSFVYQMLVDYYGYKKENIFILMANGRDSSWDNQFWLIGTPALGFGVSIKYDLDNDGQEENIQPATVEYLNQVFDNLSKTITNENDLFVFTTDHGDEDGSLMLWGEDRMSTYGLAKQLDKVSQAKSISLLMGQCFSGSFVETLKGEKRTICTAANPHESSWATQPLESPHMKVCLYDEFVYHWVNAHKDLSADTNGDGQISMLEAFKYANSNDIFTGEGYVDRGYLKLEHPQYWSDLCTGEYTFLGEGYVGEPSVEPHIVFNDEVTSGTVVVKAGQTIESQSKISGGEVSFYAGSTITLKGNFSTKSASFLAKITDIEGVCDDSENVVDPNPNPYMRDDDPNGNGNFNSELEETIATESISIYPNPTTGILHIDVAEDKNISELVVMDVTGNTLISESVSSNAVEINLSSLAKGVYFVKVITNDESYVEKVVLK